jgi:hypothetical protein
MRYGDEKMNTLDMSIIHALPGRLRVHLPDRLGAEWEHIAEIVSMTRGVIGIHESRLTGNILIRYDGSLTDEWTILGTLGHALPSACRGGKPRSAVRLPVRRTDVSATNASLEGSRDPSRVVLPVLHLVYSCSLVGVTLHVGELTWAVGRSAGPIRVAVPVLHLVLSCSPAGIALHVGELAWALVPFLTPSPRGRLSKASG